MTGRLGTNNSLNIFSADSLPLLSSFALGVAFVESSGKNSYEIRSADPSPLEEDIVQTSLDSVANFPSA